MAALAELAQNCLIDRRNFQAMMPRARPRAQRRVVVGVSTCLSDKDHGLAGETVSANA